MYESSKPTALGQIGTATDTVARENQVSRELSMLCKEVADYNSLSKTLYERLAPITRTEQEPDKAERVSPPEEYLVPMADSLRCERKGIAQSNALLRGILTRIEI